jgi:MFS family permease
VYQYGLETSIPNVLNEEFRRHYSVGPREWGDMVSVFFGTYTAMQIPVGILIDKAINPKIIALSAFFCMFCGTMLLVLSRNKTVGFLAQAIMGLGGSVSFVLLLKLSIAYFQREKATLVSGIATACGCCGPILIGTTLAYFSRQHAWENAVICVGSFGFLSFLVLAFVVDGKKTSFAVAAAEKGVTSQYIIASLGEIFSNRKAYQQFILAGIFSMMLLGAENAFCCAWGIPFLQLFYGINKLEATSAINAVFVGFAIGCPLAAWVSVKINSYKKAMIIGSAITFCLMTAIIFHKTNFLILTVLSFLFGLFGSCQFLAFPCAISSAPKNLEATVSGLVNTFTMLGGTLLIPIVGHMADHSSSTSILEDPYTAGDYQRGFIVVLASLLISFAASCFIDDISPRESKTNPNPNPNP